MNKKLVGLIGLLLIIPACQKPTRFRKTPATQRVQSHEPAERAVYDEELGAFVVKDDDNKFSASQAAQAHQEEELTGKGSELTAGDRHADSAQYGLKPIYFEFNKYKTSELQPDQKPVLAHNMQVIKSLADKGYRISIEGHACDSAGSTEYNMMLSEDRAREIKEYLKHQGVRGEILYVGYGCEHLIVPTGDRKQQAPNRRVEIYAYQPDYPERETQAA